MYHKTSQKRLILNYPSTIYSRKIVSFLSPTHKYNHRSFSASLFNKYSRPSLTNYYPYRHNNNSFLDNIRKSPQRALNGKLVKMVQPKARRIYHTSYIEYIGQYTRLEIRELLKQLTLLKQYNEQYRNQRNEDCKLIARQNSLISHLYSTISNQHHSSSLSYHTKCQNCSILYLTHNNHHQAYQYKINKLYENKKTMLAYLYILSHEIQRQKLCMIKGEEEIEKSKRLIVKLETEKKYLERSITKFKSVRLEGNLGAGCERSNTTAKQYMYQIKMTRNKEIDAIESLLNSSKHKH